MQIGLFFLGLLLALVSVFMMMLILVQRGKGGGLTGALGGMGGQSAFGAKAGDVFTRITVVTAMIWITLCMLTIALFNPPPRRIVAPTPEAITAGDQETPDAGMTPAPSESDLEFPVPSQPPGEADDAAAGGIGITGPESNSTTEPQPATGDQTAPAKPADDQPNQPSEKSPNEDGQSTSDRG